MATLSIIAACQAKLSALTPDYFPGGVLPAMYFDEAPQTTGAGAQIQPTTQGYVVLKDDGQDVLDMGFEHQTVEQANVVIEVYYPSLGDVDIAVLAIKRNNGPVGSGFDFGTLAELTSPRGTFVLKRVREQRAKAGLGKTGVPIHVCRLTYRVEILETV